MLYKCQVGFTFSTSTPCRRLGADAFRHQMPESVRGVVAGLLPRPAVSPACETQVVRPPLALYSQNPRVARLGGFQFGMGLSGRLAPGLKSRPMDPIGQLPPIARVKSGIGTTEAADALGRPVRLVDPAVDWLRGTTDRIDPESSHRIMHELVGVHRAYRRSLLRGIACVIALFLIAAALIAIDIAIEGQSAISDLLSSLIFTGPAVFAMLVAGIVVPAVRARRRRLSGVRDVMLRNARCPQCVYPISGILQDETTGLVTCPECGAAWRIESSRVNRPGDVLHG